MKWTGTLKLSRRILHFKPSIEFWRKCGGLQIISQLIQAFPNGARDKTNFFFDIFHLLMTWPTITMYCLVSKIHPYLPGFEWNYKLETNLVYVFRTLKYYAMQDAGLSWALANIGHVYLIIVQWIQIDAAKSFLTGGISGVPGSDRERQVSVLPLGLEEG